MRVVRRVAFAAPFVLVVACKRPVAEPREAHEAEPPTGFAAMPTSSMPEPPPDAAIPDAPEVVDPNRYACQDPRIKPRPNCNPPPPENPVAPRPIKARVLSAEVVGTGTIVTVSRGSDDGISIRWKACLTKQSDSDVCISGGDLELLKVGQHASKCRSTATMDQIHVSPYVKLSPP